MVNLHGSKLWILDTRGGSWWIHVFDPRGSKCWVLLDDSDASWVDPSFELLWVPVVDPG